MLRMGGPNWSNRTMWTGDNLPIMRGMNSECVDLIYLDPPFNSNRTYSAPIGSEAAGAAFKDTWTLGDVDDAWHGEIAEQNPAVYAVIGAAGEAHGNSMKSYLIMMAVRLLEMRRVLKETGSIYLHCDPTASHYLKTLTDAIFGASNFRNEIVWWRSKNPKGSQHEMRRFSPFTDTILYYVRYQTATLNLDSIRVPLTPDALSRKYPYKDEHGPYADGPILRSGSMGERPNLVYTYKGFTPAPAGWRVKREALEDIDKSGNLAWTKTGGVRRKLRPSDIENGRPVGSLWDDIPPINSQAQERVGYPTQKPLNLLDRIIKASSNEGDMVLDPFAGCATACVAAERLDRQWVGIDISEKAVDLVQVRIRKEIDLFHNFKPIRRSDIPKRTDQGKLPHYRTHKHQLFGKQEGLCGGCKVAFPFRNFTTDHIVPQSGGGSDHLEDLQLLCGACNSLKGDRGMEYLRVKLKL